MIMLLRLLIPLAVLFLLYQLVMKRGERESEPMGSDSIGLR